MPVTTQPLTYARLSNNDHTSYPPLPLSRERSLVHDSLPQLFIFGSYRDDGWAWMANYELRIEVCETMLVFGDGHLLVPETVVDLVEPGSG